MLYREKGELAGAVMTKRVIGELGLQWRPPRGWAVGWLRVPAEVSSLLPDGK